VSPTHTTENRQEVKALLSKSRTSNFNLFEELRQTTPLSIYLSPFVGAVDRVKIVRGVDVEHDELGL
jgi:hypothetical protein